jgi:ADP-ribosylglycohydrolase
MSRRAGADVRMDRFAGCLVGQALGDALGFVVEGRDPDTCGRYVEEAVRPRRLGRYRSVGHPLGQYSDDTQLARELASSLVACGGFAPGDYAGRVARLFTEGRIVGPGQTTAQAAYRIARGTPWDEAGTPPPAAGNGSAMRAAPVGLLLAHDPEAMIRMAHDQGRVTHRDPRCSAGAVAVAGATALAVIHGPPEPAVLCRTLAEWTRPFDPILAAAITELPRWVEEPLPRAASRIARVGLDPSHPDDRDGWGGIAPFVTPSVLWSLYAVLRCPGDYWETICTAIAVGGDVDTTAAMAGAISGAAVGLRGIPEDLARLVTDQGSGGHALLVELAGSLHDLHATLECKQRRRGSAAESPP